jgi:hypothetical protein
MKTISLREVETMLELYYQSNEASYFFKSKSSEIICYTKNSILSNSV